MDDLKFDMVVWFLKRPNYQWAAYIVDTKAGREVGDPMGQGETMRSALEDLVLRLAAEGIKKIVDKGATYE